jgi:NADP-reducing hydrogenase subunit HndB
MTMAKRIRSPEDLRELRDKARAETDLRSGPKDIQITVHMGTCGIAAGARDVLAQLTEEISQASVESVTLKQSGCLGLCDQEPMLTLTDKAGGEFRYGRLDNNRVRQIVHEHVLGGNPVIDCIIKT